MRLYRAKIPSIANAVIDKLCLSGDIEVLSENRAESELDLVAIMEEYLRRDYSLRNAVKEYMERHNIPFDRYGKIRGQMAGEWSHPTGDDVERFLARQFLENFMISRFVEEVYGEDKILYRTMVDLLKDQSVDENAIREEAKGKIKNLTEGTVDYEIALSKAIREVKQRHGLIAERR